MGPIRRKVIWASALAVALSLCVSVAQASAKTALINGDSVTYDDGITNASGAPVSLEQWVAEKLGYTVTVASGATWDSMTQAQFGSYDLLIIGDPDCGGTPASATSNASTWAPVVMGTAGGRTTEANRVLVSTDPEYHYLYGGGNARPSVPGDPSTAGAEHLVEGGMKFAGAQAGTGLYFSTSCFINATTVTALDMLTTTGPGNWVSGFPPCGGSVQKIANTPAFSGVSDADVQGWFCSDHTTWPTFPADWNAQFVATDTATKPTCGTDPDTGTTACGQSYVLVSGSPLTASSPNISLTPASATNPVGTSHTVTATVTNSDTPPSPVSGQAVTFTVTGVNSGATGTCTFSDGSADPSCVTGSDGVVKFTYTSNGTPGSDTINATISFGGSTQKASASKTWVASSRSGRMTGKGTVTDPSQGNVSYAYLLHCAVANSAKDTFIAQWTGNRFKLTSVTNASCSGPSNSLASFDTLTADIAGQVTNSSGTTTGWTGHLMFHYGGNPTTHAGDTASIQLVDPHGTTVINASGNPPGPFPGSSQPTGINTPSDTN